MRINQESSLKPFSSGFYSSELIWSGGATKRSSARLPPRGGEPKDGG